MPVYLSKLVIWSHRAMVLAPGLVLRCCAYKRFVVAPKSKVCWKSKRDWGGIHFFREGYHCNVWNSLLCQCWIWSGLANISLRWFLPALQWASGRITIEASSLQVGTPLFFARALNDNTVNEHNPHGPIAERPAKSRECHAEKKNRKKAREYLFIYLLTYLFTYLFICT